MMGVGRRGGNDGIWHSAFSSLQEDETYRDVVPPADPATQAFGELTAAEPRAPFALDQATFIQWAGEEQGREEQTAGDVGEVQGPPAQQAEGSADGEIALVDENPEDNQGAGDTGARDGADARANDGRGIAA